MQDSATASNPLAFDVTHRMVLNIAVPMTLGLLTIPLVGMVDMAVIGQLGSASLMGGIAIGALLFSLVANCFNFLRMGTTGLTAQAVGADDPVSQRAVAYRALFLSLVFGLAVVIFGPLVLPWSLDLMGGSDAVNDAASAYLLIRLYAMPFSLANYSIFGWLFGLGRSRLGMVLLMFLNGANILLTVWFVLGLELGVEGAAYGTIAAEILSVLIGFVLMHRILDGQWHVPLKRLFNRDAFMRFMALNRDIFLRSLIQILAFALFTSLSAQQSDEILAANELLMHFFLLGGFFLDGVATAAEQLAGRSIGARWRPAFDQTLRLTLIWGLGLAFLLSAALWLAGPMIIDMMTTATDVRQLANDYLVWAVLTPIVATLAFQLDGIFVGATWSVAMRNVSIIASTIFVISEMILIPIWGNHGLWLAMLIFLAARGAALVFFLPGRMRATFDM